MTSFPLGVCPVVGLLDQMVVLLLVLYEISTLLLLIYIPNSSAEVSPFNYIHANNSLYILYIYLCVIYILYIYLCVCIYIYNYYYFLRRSFGFVAQAGEQWRDLGSL